MRAAFPLIGYDAELMRLERALLKRESFLVTGRRFSGKTAIVQEALASTGLLDQAIWIEWPRAYRSLLEGLASALVRARDSFLLPRCAPHELPGHWAATQTSIHLRGLLWSALERTPRVIVLDGVHDATPPAYRFVQRVRYTGGATVIATAANLPDMGYLSRLYWDPARTVELKPLARSQARALLALAIDRYQLKEGENEDFRELVLHLSKGNPGCIMEMCRLASLPAYRGPNGLKLGLIQIEMAPRLLA